MIRLSIYQNGKNTLGGFTPWWHNIYEHLKQTEVCDSQESWIERRDELFAKWNCRVERIDNRGYLSFENEEDATLFLLRWS